MKILFEALIGACVVFGPALLVWTLQDPTYQIDCKNATYPIAVDLSKLTIERCKK
jgi:hypothetical protein